MMTSDLPAASSTSAASVVERARPPKLTARRHAADEHVAVGRVRLHPQPIAENRAAGERAGRIDGDDADRLAVRCESRPSADRPACSCRRRAGR